MQAEFYMGDLAAFWSMKYFSSEALIIYTASSRIGLFEAAIISSFFIPWRRGSAREVLIGCEVAAK